MTITKIQRDPDPNIWVERNGHSHFDHVSHLLQPAAFVSRGLDEEHGRLTNTVKVAARWIEVQRKLGQTFHESEKIGTTRR